MIVHVPEPKKPDPADRLAVLLFEAEAALKRVSLFPELDRDKAWPDFIELRSHTAKLLSEIHFLVTERKRAREKIERRIEALAGCVEGSAEEVELRVLADLLKPMIAMPAAILLPKYTQHVLDRLRRGAVLCRAVSITDEAVVKGGGFVYFTHPGNRPVSPGTGKRLVQSGAVLANGDGLFDDWSQTFVLNRDADVKAGRQ